MSGTDTTTGIAAVAEAAKAARGLPPVHLWNPAHCGDIDIVIRADGVWMHEGSPIGRAELVRLFSTVLRLDPDGYHLVTPAEKLKIRVEDLPFRALAMTRDGDDLVFTTDVGDVVRAGPENLITVETDPATVFYDLVEMAEERDGRLAVSSGDVWFALGPPGAGLA